MLSVVSVFCYDTGNGGARNGDKGRYFWTADKKGFISGRTGCEGHGHETGGVPMGKRSFPNKRILETIHETPACVKGITIEYYIF